MRTKKMILSVVVLLGGLIGLALDASALEIDLAPIKSEIAQAVAAGVDQETAAINAANSAAGNIYKSQKEADPAFAMTEEEIAKQILEQLGLPASPAGEGSLEGLVIDILPIEADVIAMMDTGASEQDAVKTISDDWAEKIYREQLALDPSFNVSVATISDKIQSMLWELGVDDIEDYETPEAFEQVFRQAASLSPLDDEDAASQI